MTTPRTPVTSAEPPQYRLEYEPDGSSWIARENLADILERELLGPMNGPTEVIDGVPDSVYLVGRIAPFKLAAGADDPADADTGESDSDVGDSGDAREGQGVPVTGVDDSGAGADEDSGLEDTPQQRGLMIPASMGLRCQVPDDLEAFTVTASWGTYESVPAAEGDETRIRRYQRTPVEISRRIVLADLDPSVTTEIPLRDKVVLRVDRHDDDEYHRRVVEVALCNDREAPRKIPVDAWLYQAKLTMLTDGEPAFLPVTDALTDDRWERDDEVRRLNLQYRDRLEFAVGRTCSVSWEEPAGWDSPKIRAVPGNRRVGKIWTTWLPVSETPQVAADEIDEALLDMRKLAAASEAELRAGLAPIAEKYGSWLDGEETRANQLPGHLRDEGLDAVHEARKVQRQLAAGIEHLLGDADALRCFRFMNEVMADQRVQSQVARRRASRPAESLDEARAAVLAGDRPHSWRTFQLAFILMQLPLLTDPAAQMRSGDLAKAQLLFFPTGGGKTEAYLGLAAYAFAIRRLQGVVQAADGSLDGGAGVTVLMRYTLRLLTAQQFQRATALVCAAEMARRRDVQAWGTEPFRIGLWVGTDVSPKRYKEAKEQLDRSSSSGGYSRLTVLQFQRCPWCGTPISAANVRPDDEHQRVYVYCGDELGDCPFSRDGSVPEGLPVLTVDEEIYRLAPAFVIATVDKFARLAREGEAAALFGYVAEKCERHGYVHPDYQGCKIAVGSKHPKTTAYRRPVTRLRPPDLIIQDELHLIAGALGTTVGLFEVAVDALCWWRTPADLPVRPLLVASTATARNAADQVRALYGRGTTIFPPQVLDAGTTFFSAEQPISRKYPGRRYVGISTSGVRLTTAEIRVSEVLMAAGQLLLDRSGDVADPYLTLVGYFSATRELAGMARYMGDDVQTALAKGHPWSRLPRRFGTVGQLHLAELTSRVSSADITGTLDQMAVSFDPEFDSTAARRDRAARRKAKQKVPDRPVRPFDVVLATSMLQVGVDVDRLGLMLVVGQPKNTAEYIQASSRVGRQASRPGLVVALGNWARPRDLAHFEQFRHYHETFYAQVEALSVTPFSATSLDRGLDGVLISAARVLEAVVPGGLSAEKNAGRIEDRRDVVVEVIDALVRRIGRAATESDAERARARLLNRLDQWVSRRKHLAELHKTLVYERFSASEEGKYDALMMSAENARALGNGSDVAPFVVANSMREVQPEINLLVSPIKDNLIYIAPPGAPQWEFPPAEEVTS
ncbi:DISARM system helicase DrmA [Frankia gtarii]|uniref:DISARM system helicase DrmA n=1 Tax=Frankia gtarii TaxID=2950102 RepID=UPI0021C11E32|nr:DISARM system helicase DrmA [Frankia gtarii]